MNLEKPKFEEHFTWLLWDSLGSGFRVPLRVPYYGLTSLAFSGFLDELLRGYFEVFKV